MTPKEKADEIVKEVGVKEAILIVNDAIDIKRKKEYNSLTASILATELDFLREVKIEIEKL